MPDPCLNEERIAHHEKKLRFVSAWRHGLLEWLVISASIAVLLLSFHISTSIKSTSESALRMESLMQEQNRLLGTLHLSIHEEGRAIVESHDESRK